MIWTLTLAVKQNVEGWSVSCIVYESEKKSIKGTKDRTAKCAYGKDVLREEDSLWVDGHTRVLTPFPQLLLMSKET